MAGKGGKPPAKPKYSWRQYSAECQGKKGRSAKCREMLRSLQKKPLRKAARERTITPSKKVPHLIDVDQFYHNPIVFYRKMLESYAEDRTYTEFKATDRFTAIVLARVTINKTKDLSLLFGNLTAEYDEDFGTFRGSEIQLFQIFIPDLDGTIPIKEADPVANQEIITSFLSGNDRMAVYAGKETIEPGYLVKVSGIINADKAAKIPEIVEVISDTAVVDLSEDPKEASEALKKCLPGLKLTPPTVRPAAAPLPSISKVGLFQGKNIYSSFDNDNNEEDHPKILKNRTTPTPAQTKPPQTREEIRQAEIKRIQAGIGKVDECELVVVPQTFPEPEKGQEKKVPEDKYIFINEDSDSSVTGIKHYIDKKLIYFEASEEQNSASPAQFVPVGVRQPTIIVIKEAPYLNIKDYIEGVKADKASAAHFCIDNKGIIYQFTDVNNIIKSYNPTIDETSIQIAVLNISYRNSKETIDFLKKRNGSEEYAVALSLKYYSDVLKLKAFYKRKENIDKQEVSPVGLPVGFLRGKTLKEKLYTKLFLWDKPLIPDYRLDITDRQKGSLNKIVLRLHNIYETIALKVPEGYSLDKTGEFIVQQYEPSIAAGDFSGICCPYNFLQSSTNGIFLLNEIIGT